MKERWGETRKRKTGSAASVQVLLEVGRHAIKTLNCVRAALQDTNEMLWGICDTDDFFFFLKYYFNM